jgi:hypothetical protein
MPTDESNKDWVAETKAKIAADDRAQPWKESLGGLVDQATEPKEDLVAVRDNGDVQHTSVAA